MQIANDLTPKIRELTATERAYRAIDFTTARIAERSRLSSKDREARAAHYDERAASYMALAQTYPTMAEFAGLNSLAASILRSRE